MKEALIEITIRGIAPLIMSNGRMADPLDPYAKLKKAYTSKTKKTDEDYASLADIEFEAALYWSDEIGVYLPAENLQRMLHDAAKKIKLGRQIVHAVVNEAPPLIFDDHDNLAALKARKDIHFRAICGVNGKKVVVCRPRIPTGWTSTFTVSLDLVEMDIRQFEQVIEIAGRKIGLGNWRPAAPKVPGRYGRFVVEKMEVAA